MLGRLGIRKFYRTGFLILAFFAINIVGCAPAASAPSEQAAAKSSNKKIDVFQILIVNEDGTSKGKEKAYTLAGVVIDRSRKVKRKLTDAEVKVTGKMPTGKNMGKSYDVVFLVRPSAISKGKILTLTSGPVKGCRSFLKKFLTKVLSPKRIKKAYKGAKLATVDKDSNARSLAEKLAESGWLRKCS